MHTLPASTPTATQRYAKTIEVSKRIRWDIDRDIIRGREFDLKQKFLPDGLSLIDELPAAGAQASQIEAGLLKAYRWQYIVSGTLEPRFQHVLGELVSERQMARIQEALGPLTYAMPAPAGAELATAH